jgi:hypothetical protein
MKEKDLRSARKQELLEIAAGLGIPGRSKMNKAELASAIAKTEKPRKAKKAGKSAKAARTTKPTKTGKKETGSRTAGKRSKAKAKPMRASAGRVGAKRGAARRKGPIREGTLVRRSWREQQAVVQQAKYETKMAPAGKPTTVTTVEAQELPTSYDEDRIVLLVRVEQDHHSEGCPL